MMMIYIINLTRLLCLTIVLDSVFAAPRLTKVYPPKFTVQPSNLVVQPFQPTEMTCGAEDTGRGGTTIIKWYHNGKEIKARDPESPMRTPSLVGPLIFLSVTNKDEGVYHCEAVNEAGVVRSRSATLNIAFLDEDFKVSPRKKSVGVGGTLHLECTPPQGIPHPTVIWLKDGLPVNVGSDRSRIYLQSNSTNLVIEEVRTSDQGVYACRAENMVGQRQTPSVKVAVNNKLHFSKKPSDVTAMAGDDIRLECAVSNKADTRFTWVKESENGDRVTMSDLYTSDGAKKVEIINEETEINSSIIRVFDVSPEDEGRYICIASSKGDQEKISSSANIIIQSRPIFLVRPDSQKKAVNETVHLECMATGSPKAEVYWMKQGSPDLFFPDTEYSDGRITVDSSSTLTIDPLTEEDQGIYICHAVSPIGAITAKAVVEVISDVAMTTDIASGDYFRQPWLLLLIAAILCILITLAVVIYLFLKQYPVNKANGGSVSASFKPQNLSDPCPDWIHSTAYSMCSKEQQLLLERQFMNNLTQQFSSEYASPGDQDGSDYSEVDHGFHELTPNQYHKPTEHDIPEPYASTAILANLPRRNETNRMTPPSRCYRPPTDLRFDTYEPHEAQQLLHRDTSHQSFRSSPSHSHNSSLTSGRARNAMPTVHSTSSNSTMEYAPQFDSTRSNRSHSSHGSTFGYSGQPVYRTTVEE